MSIIFRKKYPDRPQAPTVLDATDVTDTSFFANWSSVSSATSYRLDVSEYADFRSFIGSYNNYTVNGTSQAVTGLTAGTTYYYRVRAVKAGWTTSENSNTISLTTYTAEAQAYFARVEADGGVVQNLQAINTAYKLFRTNLVWGIMIDGGIKREAGSPSYVEKVYDLATTARDCVQGTPAARPFFVENAIGDKPGIRFSGAQFMEFGNDNLINTAQPFTLVAVFLPKAISSTKWGHIACIRTELSTGIYAASVTSATGYKIFPFGHVSGARLTIDNSTLFAVNTPVHAQLKYNGSGWNTSNNHIATINGQDIATQSAASFSVSKTSNRIGFLDASNHYFDGEICEILLLNTNALTSTISAYLKAKYGFGA